MKIIIKSLLLLFLLHTTILSNAQLSIAQLGPNYFVAGPTTAEFQFFVAEQKCPNWCWAACIQMVLNYHGLIVSQQNVVQKIYGRQVCVTANNLQILNALTGWAPDYRGRFSQIYSQYGVFNKLDIINNLSHKWPIIVGLQNPGGIGHVYVLTAIYYYIDKFNNPIIEKVVLRDPWPTNLSRQEWPWNIFLSRSPEFFKVWINRL
jgi:hypothetical protein